MTTTETEVSIEPVRAFLYREARLLDDHDYDGWLELWDDAGIYWIPADRRYTDPETQVSLIYDNRRRLAMRVAQLQTGYRYAQLPQSTTQHYITNVEITDRAPGQVEVRSSFLVMEARFGEMHQWPGRAVHTLTAGPGGPAGDMRILRKQVVLINNDQPVTSMAFLL